MPTYRLSCDVIAATLGSRGRLDALLPWAVLDGKARSLMQDLGYKPATEEARASWAVARRDFSAALSMGEVAIEPLLSLFRNTVENRDGFGVLTATDSANARALVAAAGTLAAIADDRASEGLAGFLNDHDAARSSPNRDLEPALVASLRALGSVGTAFTVATLDEWSKTAGNPGCEARRAADQVRRRLVFAQQPAVGDLLARAGAYVARFKRDLAALVVGERYEQDAKSPFGTVVTSVQAVPHRELKSDVMLVRPAGADQFVLFRDVFEVDGRQVRDREERLMKMFLNPSGTNDEQIREIVTASARFNIGNVYRNINTPTLGLLLLDPTTQRRFSFRLADDNAPALARNQSAGDAGPFVPPPDTIVIEYREVVTPTLIRRIGGGNEAARGRFWIDPATGAIIISELAVDDATHRVLIDVAYQRDAGTSIRVPVEMRERYVNITDRSVTTGRAIYSNVRRFQVQVDENIPLPDVPNR